MDNRRTYKNITAFEMDDGTIYVKPSRERIPVAYMPVPDEDQAAATLAARFNDGWAWENRPEQQKEYWREHVRALLSSAPLE